MKALVTGGNGLVGSALVTLLLKEGHEAAVLDMRFDTPYLSEPEKSTISFYKADISRPEHIFEAVSDFKPDAIFHMAAMLSVPSEADPQSAFWVNGAGMYHMLEAARICKVSQFMFTSSMVVFDLDIKSDMIDDDTLQRPRSLYGVCKVFGENLGRYYRTKYGLDFRCVRFPSIAGPGAKVKHASIHNSWMIEKSYYGEPYSVAVTPETEAGVLYFRDAAYSLYKLSQTPKKKIEKVCYCLTGRRVAAGELAEKVMAKLPDAKITFEPEDEIMRFYESRKGIRSSEENAVEEWGWEVSYSVDEMIDDFCACLKNRDDNIGSGGR
jgi:threonine 3-dehydrogenase